MNYFLNAVLFEYIVATLISSHLGVEEGSHISTVDFTPLIAIVVIVLVSIFAIIRDALKQPMNLEGSWAYHPSNQQEQEHPQEQEEEHAAPPSRRPEQCRYCGAAILVHDPQFRWNCGASLRRDDMPVAEPVTKRGRLLKKKCMVCDLQLSSADEIVHCPHCGNLAHKDHLLEWLHVKGSCPICHQNIEENELRARVNKRHRQRFYVPTRETKFVPLRENH